MENDRKQQGGEKGVQLIKLTGPRCIVRKPLQAPAKLAGTWYDFLRGQGIKLTPKDGICVKTARNTWPVRTADLSEPVGVLVGRYSIRRRVYTVELMTNKVGGRSGRQVIPGSGGGSNAGPSSSRSGAELVEEAVDGPPPVVKVEATAGPTPPVKIEPMDAPLPDAVVKVEPHVIDDDAAGFVGQRIINVRTLAQNEAAVPLETSAETGPSRNRIEDEELQSCIAQRLANLPASLLMGARKEYKNLKTRHPQKWDRNVDKAPLSSYFLQEILQ